MKGLCCRQSSVVRCQFSFHVVTCHVRPFVLLTVLLTVKANENICIDDIEEHHSGSVLKGDASDLDAVWLINTSVYRSLSAFKTYRKSLTSLMSCYRFSSPVDSFHGP